MEEQGAMVAAAVQVMVGAIKAQDTAGADRDTSGAVDIAQGRKTDMLNITAEADGNSRTEG